MYTDVDSDCRFAKRIDHVEGPGAWHQYVCTLWHHNNCNICKDFSPILRKDSTNVEEMRKELEKNDH